MDILSMPGTTAFLAVIVTGIVVMALSRLLDHVWAHVLRVPWLYLAVSAPGIIVHECAHILGCIVTGAHITKIVLISKEGGMVSYTKPKVPVIGNVIISTAPLFCLPLVLAGLSWIFATYAGCRFSSGLLSFGSVSSLVLLFSAIGQTLYDNLVASFNIWFLLYLYLVISLVLSVAPSLQDLKNAVAGLFVLILAGFLILFSGIPVLTSAFLELIGLLGTELAIGLAFECVALVVTLPFLLFYKKPA
jgi:hypothetical protein